jgi:hypothetical protein
MSWGDSGNVVTTNLDSDADDPSLARADLKEALDELVAVIDGRGAASGVASLGTDTKVPNTQLPDELISSSTQNLILNPDTDRVAIENIINLNPQTVAELTALSAVEGDVAYCSNGDSGSKCIAIYNGTDWKVVSLGATIST